MAPSPDNSIDLARRELLAGAERLALNARRAVRWRAGLGVLAVALALLVVLLVADIWLRREEVGLRILGVTAWLVTLAGGIYFWVRPAWRFSPSAIDVARWIELHDTRLAGQLATAVELATLPADETRFGSRGFRDSAFKQLCQSNQPPDWSRYLDLSGLRRAGMKCGVGLGLFLLVWWIWPQELPVAMARLVLPWSDNHWPRRDQLEFQNPPAVIAVGSELQLEIIDRHPPLPPNVELQTRSVQAGQRAPVSGMAPGPIEAIQVGDVAIANLSSVSSTIEVRAVGGEDHHMPWHRIEVVQPPDLLDYQFTVQPPSYSALPAAEVVGNRISVLAGSRVAFEGRFSEPIRTVRLLRAAAATAQSNGPAEPLATDQSITTAAAEANTSPTSPDQIWSARIENQRELRIGDAQGQAVVFEQSLTWQLAIVTASGLEMELPQRWRIEVTADAVPVVALQPAEMTELAANANLALRGSASDDLSLVEVVARLKLDGQESAAALSLPIWSQAQDSHSGEEPPPFEASVVKDLVVDATWNLAQTSGVQAGQRVVVWLEGRDSAGQWGRSAERQYDIREPQELARSFEGRQNQLLSKVREFVDVQRRNAQLFTRGLEEARAAERLERAQLDMFRNVAQVQRGLQRQFPADPAAGGLTQELAKLKQLLVQNRLDASELAQEFQLLERMIVALGKGPLSAASSSSQASFQRAQAWQADPQLSAAELLSSGQATTAAQAAALSGLEELLDRLARNEALQQVQRELAQILNQQNTLRDETDQLQLQRLSSPEDGSLRAKQAALSSDQLGLARRLDDLIRRADELQATASDDQQSLKVQLAQATQTLLSEQVSAKMRQSTEELRQEKLAQSAATQQQVANLLEQTLGQLGAANNSQLGSLQNRADGLRQTTQALNKLAEEQASLSTQWTASGAQDNAELRSQQQQLEQRTQAQAQQATKQGDSRLANQLEMAINQQQAAQKASEQQAWQQAAQAAAQAAEQLSQAVEQLQSRAAQLEEQVAEQQISELTTAVEQLVMQQRPVTEQFKQLPEPAADEQQAHRQQAIRQLTLQQEEVRQALRGVRGQTSQLPIFDWTLQQAEAFMSRAVAAGQRFRLRPDAQLAAEDSLRLLELTLAAMLQQAQQPTESPEADAADNAEQPGADQEPAPRPVPMIASLKLLRSLQQDVNARTAVAQGNSDPAQRNQRLSELSQMQQALGEQIEQLLREWAAANDTGDGP